MSDDDAEDSIVMYEGRYSFTTPDANNLKAVEVIVDAQSTSPADAETLVRSVVDLYNNKSGILVSGIGLCTFRSTLPKYRGRIEKRYLYRAELVVTYE
jgi:hypothetical protein